jgi:hypothetical protein
VFEDTDRKTARLSTKRWQPAGLQRSADASREWRTNRIGSAGQSARPSAGTGLAVEGQRSASDAGFSGSSCAPEEAMSNFAIYLVGFLIVIGGLAWAAVSLGAPPMWIGIGAVILLGLGVVSGVSKTRIRESSSGDASAKRVIVSDGD